MASSAPRGATARRRETTADRRARTNATTTTRRRAPRGTGATATGTMRRTPSFSDELGHYVKGFGRHDAYAGGEQVRERDAR